MQPTGDPIDRSIADETWRPPLEADPADAREQMCELVDDSGDPEAPVTPAPPSDLDLTRASEADLAEQLYEVPLDDDADAR